NAHFEGTGGAVTVAGAIASVSSMSFDASGYSLNGGTIHLTGLAIVTANYDTTISSSIDGSAAGMVKDGEGRLTVSGASSFGSGEAIQTITVSEGTLRLNQSGLGWSGSGWGNNAPIVVDSEATLELAGRFNSGHARPITVDGGTLAITTAGSSTDGDNYFNDLTLRNGAVVTGRPFRVGGNVDGMITVGGTEASNIDAGVILVGLTGSTGVAFNVDAATSGSGPDLTISGVIRDYTASQTLDVFKEGPGTLVLSGDNAYTSATTVKAGTLLVNNTSGSGTGSGPVAVRSDATLGGTGAIAGAVTIEEGGTLGTRTGIDSLTFGSTLTLEDGTVWDWAFINNVDGNYDQADGPNLVLPNEGIVTLNIWGLDDHSVGWYDEFTLFTGDVENFDAGLFQLENHSDWTRGWKVSLGNSLVLTAVPEPGAWLLLLSALVSGMLVRRRRR
ncbi:MAG: autotransporter-associated beta strand repeat-containing protein, partial [Thermoguttaceae bacterium]|nr:autotransporter-associated beta strand repeat-containing protein [Thermoguttaceae bacterium]